MWQDCGVYTQQLRNENVVHALEHGTVWITYRPGTSPADVQALQTALRLRVKDKKTILSPYPRSPHARRGHGLGRPAGPEGRVRPEASSVLVEFYGDGHTAPEAAMASCAGGKVVYASPSNP